MKSIILAAGVVLCTCMTLHADNAPSDDMIARGGRGVGRVGVGARGVGVRAGGYYRGPGVTRAGSYARGAARGAAYGSAYGSSGYYYPTTPYYYNSSTYPYPYYY